MRYIIIFLLFFNSAWGQGITDVFPVLSAKVVVPNAPTSVSANAGDAQATVSWVNPFNGYSKNLGFKIYRSTTSGSGFTLIFTVTDPNALSYTNTGLTNGTTYYYKVSAYNILGEGAQSAQTSATPVASSGGQGAFIKVTKTLDPNNRDRFGNIHPMVKGYIYSLPPDYASNPSRKYALFISFHGTGEIGQGTSASLDKLLNVGLPQRRQLGNFPTNVTSPTNGTQYSFIIMAPQFVDNDNRNQPMFDSVKAEALRIFAGRIDLTRIYTLGLSQGGGFEEFYNVTSKYCGQNPDGSSKFCGWGSTQQTASIIVCGNTDPQSLGGMQYWSQGHLPAWWTHNNGDPTVGPELSQKWYDTLTNANYPTPVYDITEGQLTFFVANSHNAWTTTTNPSTTKLIDGQQMNIYQWVLKFCRGCSDGAINVNASISIGTVSDWAVNENKNKLPLWQTKLE